jgi:predicted O-methyltransferase YrrM
VRATRARRILEIGTGSGESARAMAAAMSADGMLITIERDAAAAAAARQAFIASGIAARVTTVVGDAARYLHKLAGPFDVVFHDGDVTQYASLHPRVVALLAPSATLITNNVHSSRDYNEVLAADERLTSVVVNIGGGVALSVRKRMDGSRNAG